MIARADEARNACGLTARAALAILSIGVIALTLLSYRQMRLQAMHELSAARLRQADHDKRLWEIRSQIAGMVTPERIGVLPEPPSGGPEIESAAPEGS